MDIMLTYPVIFIGAVIVFVSAMVRFNDPEVLSSELPAKNWIDILKNSLKFNPGQHNILFRPIRANTTIFRYNLYQFVYAIINLVVYLALLRPDILEQVQVIINNMFQTQIPDMANPGPLVIAAFVIFVLPKVPPFRWGDIKIRTILYERALIPAQQLRETHRLKMAEFHPSSDFVERVRELAVAEGFDRSDIDYNCDFPTTQSLWTKCVILIEQIKIWEADDHYKTAFASLKEPDCERRTVDVIKEMERNLSSDARVCLLELRKNQGNKSEELENREAKFRNNCRALLLKIYSLLACVSLHSHYSDQERIKKFDKLGFKLKAGPNGPIPDSNDILILTIIVCTVVVLPLAYSLGLVKAIMIGMIMFSAVLTPIILAHFCPQMCEGDKEEETKPRQKLPNVRFPILSGLIAAVLGFLIFSIGGSFIEPDSYCKFTGYERYIECSYPWSFVHAGVALVLAILMSRGHYPDVQQLLGVQKYRQWGDVKDGVSSALALIAITMILVIPQLEKIRGHSIEGGEYYNILWRMALIAFVLGFIVPTWFRARAQNRLFTKERRVNLKERQRFMDELRSIRNGTNRSISDN